MEYASVKDGGERTNFETGATREITNNKGRFDLISPIFLIRLAKHYQNGAKKYSERNWEKGLPLNSYIDSALRHLITYLEGCREEDHLAAAAWNIACLIHTEEMIKRSKLSSDLNNLPTYKE